MKSILFGTVVGGLTLFVWSAVLWMALPWHTAFRSFSNEDALMHALTDGFKQPGMYTIPGGYEIGTAEQKMAAAEKIAKGPVVFASVRPARVGSLTAMFVRQAIIQFVTAFVLVLLLRRAAPTGFARTVWFSAGVGLTGGIATRVAEWNWWGFPTGYTAMQVADMVIGFALAGCAIAAAMRTAAEVKKPQVAANGQRRAKAASA